MTDWFARAAEIAAVDALRAELEPAASQSRKAAGVTDCS